MRTTISVEEKVLEAAKAEAASRGTTLSAFIEDAVRMVLMQRREPAQAPPFRLVTAGSGGTWPGVDLDRHSLLQEVDDVRKHGE